MSPVASAVRRPGSAGRAPAVVVLAVLALLAALAHPQSARAEPTEPTDWVYEFADFTATPAVTDYDDRTVTLTGVLLRHPSYGGPLQPADGEQVDLVQSAGGTGSGGSGSGDTGSDGQSLGTVTTDLAGRFTLPDAEIDQRPDQSADPVPGPFTVQVSAVHQDESQGSSPSPDAADATVQTGLEVTATPSAARLTVDYELGDATAAGRTVVAQGILERDTLLGRQPVQGTAVTVEYRPSDGAAPLSRQTTTGPDGRFTVVFTATAAGDVVTSADWSADPYLDLAEVRGLARQIAVPPVTPSPTTTTTTALPPSSVPHASPATAAGPALRTTAPSSRAPRPTTAGPKPASPGNEPNTLAVTGGGASREALLMCGSVMLGTGLLLMVVRRRIRGIG